MKQLQMHRLRGFWLIPVWGFLGMLHVSAARAQVIADTSLDGESSRVVQDAMVRGQLADLIEGGATRGSNLFHSFAEFNVGEGQRVYFANPTGIETIFSRITGSSGSDIMGTLGVDGGANLFLLNPNGIVFGPNAQLDISGSFLASTADSFAFADGSEFSATSPQAPELLSVNMPLGVQWGPGGGGPLTNNANLAVPRGQSLTLIGGDVTHTGSLAAPGGRVEVLGNTVSLVETATIDVSGPTGGGTVLIGGDYQGQGTTPRAARTLIGPEVIINADAITSGDGGTVIVWADDSTQFYGTISAQGGSEMGDGGFVEVSSPRALIFDGQVDTRAPNGSIGLLLIDPENIRIVSDGTVVDGEVAIFVSTINNATTNVMLQATNNITFDEQINISSEEVGLSATAGSTIEVKSAITTNRGDINFTSNRVLIYASVLAGTDTINPGGNITIEAKEILISGNNVQVSSNTNGPGPGGTIIIQNADILEVRDEGFLGSRSNRGNPLENPTGADPTGRSGSMTINARQLLIENGGVVSTSAFRQGDAGELVVNSDFVRVSGIFKNVGPQSFLGSITTSPEPEAGNANSTVINARQLVVEDGAWVATSTDGAGDGGNLNIVNSDLVRVSGVNVNGTPSFLGSRSSWTAADVSPENVGNAGNLLIETRRLFVENGGQISSSTFGGGQGGNVEVVSAELIQISGFTEIPATGQIFSSLLAAQSISQDENAGSAGSVSLNAESIVVSNLGEAAVNRGILVSSNGGGAGVATIEANSLILDQGFIQARSTGSAETGGIINIKINGNILQLENQSQITAQATGRPDGGEIRISIPNGFLITRPGSNSDIVASAEEGDGGVIEVEAFAIFGIEPRDFDSPFSDFLANSQSGTDGEILLLTLGIDPSRGLAELPVDVIDVAGLVATGCVGDNRSGVEDQGEFSVIGRGGLSPGPTEVLTAPGSPASLATLDGETLGDRPTAAPSVDTAPVERLEEAQGLAKDADGRVTLAAQGRGDSGSPAAAAALNCNAL